MPLILLLLPLLITGCVLRNDVDTAFAEVAAESVETCDEAAAAGELVGHYQLASCKAEVLLANLRHGRYPYMDLAESYTEQVRELAIQADCDERPVEEVAHYSNVAYGEWLNAEQERCEVDRLAIDRRKPGLWDMRPILDELKQTRTFDCYDLQSTRIFIQ